MTEQEKIDEAFKRGYELGKKVQSERLLELIILSKYVKVIKPGESTNGN